MSKRRSPKPALVLDGPDLDHGDDLGPAAISRASRIVAVADPELARNTVGATKTSVRRYLESCVLDWLGNRGYLDEAQHRSGIRFRRAWLASYHAGSGIAGYTPRIAANGPTGVPRVPERRLIAQDTCSDLLALMTPELASVTVDVCGSDLRVAGRLDLLRRAMDVLTAEFEHDDAQRGLR